MTGLQKVLTEISQRGYSTTINLVASGEQREAIRKEDRERGRDKPWAASIRARDTAVTDFETGYGDGPLEAVVEAMDRSGLKITGINL